MAEMRDWQGMKDMMVRLLEENTGAGLAVWNQRVGDAGPADEKSLRAWLAAQGVTGYAQSLLVMERFGYPDFLVTSAEDLINNQFSDRPGLRPIYDALISAAAALGEVAVQARKTYTSLVTPRRTFARIQPTTRTRLDVALRIEGLAPGGRLTTSNIHESMPVQISLKALGELDAEVLEWLQRAYDENE